jgi:hypothetical protein
MNPALHNLADVDRAELCRMVDPPASGTPAFRPRFKD